MSSFSKCIMGLYSLYSRRFPVWAKSDMTASVCRHAGIQVWLFHTTEGMTHTLKLLYGNYKYSNAVDLNSLLLSADRWSPSEGRRSVCLRRPAQNPGSVHSSSEPQRSRPSRNASDPTGPMCLDSARIKSQVKVMNLECVSVEVCRKEMERCRPGSCRSAPPSGWPQCCRVLLSAGVVWRERDDTSWWCLCLETAALEPEHAGPSEDTNTIQHLLQD